jgi:hypothetical protein
MKKQYQVPKIKVVNIVMHHHLLAGSETGSPGPEAGYISNPGFSAGSRGLSEWDDEEEG